MHSISKTIVTRQLMNQSNMHTVKKNLNIVSQDYPDGRYKSKITVHIAEKQKKKKNYTRRMKS